MWLAILQTVAEAGWIFSEFYPPQYDAIKLNSDEHITLDGKLDDPAWKEVPFTSSDFVDLSQPLYNSSAIPPKDYQTQVKVRWDDNYLYVGAIVHEHFPFATIPKGHNGHEVPYKDHDFEVFIEVSGTTYFYKEFETNLNCATYDVLWHLHTPDGFKIDVWTANTTSPFYSGNWTMYPGLQCATSLSKGNGLESFISTEKCPPDTPGAYTAWSQVSEDCPLPSAAKSFWTVELRFPLRANDEHGGLTDTWKDQEAAAEAGLDFSQFDPAKTLQNKWGVPLFWWVDFSRANHPVSVNGTEIKAIEDGNLLQNIQSVYPSLLGPAPWNNYWEWAWSPVGATKYMHFPAYYGQLRFVEEKTPTCRNAEWPGRFVAEQFWWALLKYTTSRNETFNSDIYPLEDLLRPQYCEEYYCNRDVLRFALAEYEEYYELSTTEISATACIGTLVLSDGKPHCYIAEVAVKSTTISYVVKVRSDKFTTVTYLSAPSEKLVCLEDL